MSFYRILSIEALTEREELVRILIVRILTIFLGVLSLKPTETKMAEMNRLFREFIALYHQKLGICLQADDQQEPRCNKNQKRALFILHEKGRVTPSELGRALDLQKATLTSLVDSLAAHNLVRREPDPADRRKTWLELTEAGSEYVRMKKAAYDRYFAGRFAAVSEAEIEESLLSLKRLVDIMGKL
ncbi:MarR family transcriptional regulator [Hydrogenispora ethanolica]|uniref:MarR family transcriptional regulator n=1 Tax=Hydrogenispora ethanolica TaxID=1082276 RepID=A0A4R1R994_HYDET|nr:MarR family transcriptional regulator [Hydrogenispora ethanolica]